MSYKKNKFKISRKTKAFKFLMDEFDLNMREAQRWIDKGRLLIDGKAIIKKSQELFGEVEVILFETKSKNLSAIFETTDFLVYDKPSGLLVHPANRDTSYSLTHEIKHKYGKDANITHRIDKETSGLVIASKTKDCETTFKLMFEKKRVKKTYLCFVKGELKKNFTIDAPIYKNRDYSKIKLKVLIDRRGKESQTIINPIFYDKKSNITLIRALPLTGRQHQIRVHLYHIGYPIVGDPIYGVDSDFANRYLNKIVSNSERIDITGSNRLLLHAESIEFFYKKNRYKIVSRMNSTFSSLYSHQ